MQTTDQGVPYYVDHINKRTSWDPPVMSSGGMSVIASDQPDIRECGRPAGRPAGRVVPPAFVGILVAS